MRTFPTVSKITTRITLHSTTIMRPQESTATPLGCWRTSAPNFRMKCPDFENICTCMKSGCPVDESLPLENTCSEGASNEEDTDRDKLLLEISTTLGFSPFKEIS